MRWRRTTRRRTRKQAVPSKRKIPYADAPARQQAAFLLRLIRGVRRKR